MGCHVSAVPNHQLGRVTPISLRGDVATPGQLGYELDLNKLSDADMEEVKAQVLRYRSLGEIFHRGDLYRLVNPDEDDCTALEFISEDEYVEVTPNHIRLRKIILDDLERKRANRNN